MGASPALMGKCAENNIGLSFLKPNGEFLSKVIGKTKGSVFLRKKQYNFSDDTDWCLKFAQDIVSAKLFNQRFTLERAIRDNKEKINTDKLERISAELKNAIKKIAPPTKNEWGGKGGKLNNLQSLNLYEINKSRIYSFRNNTEKNLIDKK